MFGAMEEIEWDRDDMRDILARDRRYHSRAYEFLQYVIGRISEESPIGRALMGRHAGDEILVEAPGGDLRFRILAAEQR